MAFCGYALYLPGVLLLYSGTITIFLRFSLIKPFFSLGFWVWFERTLFLTSSLGIAWFLYWTWARRTCKFSVGGLIRWYHHLLCSRVPYPVAELRPSIVKIRISVFLSWMALVSPSGNRSFPALYPKITSWTGISFSTRFWILLPGFCLWLPIYTGVISVYVWIPKLLHTWRSEVIYVYLVHFWFTLIPRILILLYFLNLPAFIAFRCSLAAKGFLLGFDVPLGCRPVQVLTAYFLVAVRPVFHFTVDCS